MNEPNSEFEDLVDDMTTPRPSPATAIRVVAVHFGIDHVGPAIETSGMSLVSSLNVRRDLPDFDIMPEFDIVVSDTLAAPSTWPETIQYILRFLRVRTPPAFVFPGCTDQDFRAAMAGASHPYGYEVSISRDGDLGFIAGINLREPEGEAWEKIDEVIGRIQEGLTDSAKG